MPLSILGAPEPSIYEFIILGCLALTTFIVWLSGWFERKEPIWEWIGK